MNTKPHLEPEVVEVLDYPLEQRIEFCLTDRWIAYTRANEILMQLRDLFHHPKALRMQNLLIVGQSGNGKSSIIERFVNTHPSVLTPTGDAVIPIIRIEMPDTPDESEFWSVILFACRISHRERDSAAIKKRQAKAALQQIQARLLIIDEFNNLVNAGKLSAYLLAAIKGLSNDLKMSIVAAGTPAATNALNSDPQMKSRFVPCPLHRWKPNQEYQRFLRSYERLLPLAEPSDLAKPDMAGKLYSLAGETIGSTVRLLKSAATKALQTGRERITPEVIDQVEWVKAANWDMVNKVI